MLDGVHGLGVRRRSGELVISDAHQGLADAPTSVLDGACWRLCRTYSLSKLLVSVPEHACRNMSSFLNTQHSNQHH